MFVGRRILSGLVTALRLPFAQQSIKGVYWTDRKVKRIAYNKPFKNESYADELKLPSGEQQQLPRIFLYTMKNDIQNYTSQNIAMLAYSFSKKDLMTPKMFDRLFSQLAKFEGEFTSRSLYGLLYTAVKYSNQKYVNYLVEHIDDQKHVFTPGESIEIIDALMMNQKWSLKKKKAFWNKFFYQSLQEFMKLEYRDNNPKRILRIIKNLQKLQIYDHHIWEKLIKLLHNKHGWVRVEIYEALSPHMERFPEAQQLVDIIYSQISTNPDVTWRYNLQERRMYSNAQMIAKSQDNINLIPNFRSIFPMEHVKELNERFEQLKATGTLLEEAQIQQDKAKALAYVLYDKFYRDKSERDNTATSEYEKVYGMNQDQIKKLIANAEITAQQQDQSDDEADDEDAKEDDDEQEDEQEEDGDEEGDENTPEEQQSQTSESQEQSSSEQN